MYRFTLTTVTILLAVLLQAQSGKQLDVNNVSAFINPANNQFCNRDMANQSPSYLFPGFEFPKNSGKNTMFTCGVWLSGADLNDNIYASADRYSISNRDFIPGPLHTLNGTIDLNTILQYNRVWMVSEQEIADFKAWFANPSSMPNYQIPTDIISWPGGNPYHPEAPYVDVNGDYKYDAVNDGDYPLIPGDRAAFVVLNDVGASQAESGGTPMKLELQCMFYAFDCPESEAMNNTIFAKYKVFNRSQETYQDFVFSLFIDYDIGCTYNDYTGTDVPRGLVYAYNGTLPDTCSSYYNTNGYGTSPVASGAMILKGPKMPFNGTDDALLSRYGVNGVGFEDGIVDNEYYGLTNSMAFNNIGNVSTNVGVDPTHDTGYYHFSRSCWTDGEPLTYGGSGYQGSSLICDYIFPGSSDTVHYYGTNFQQPAISEWSEESAGTTPFDRRVLLSSGDNTTLAPGDYIEVDVAFVNAMKTSGTSMDAVYQLQSYADSIRKYFFTGQTPCGTDFITSIDSKIEKKELAYNIFPNPADDVVNINLDYDGSYKLRLFSISGEMVLSKTAETRNSRLDIGHLQAGFYLLEIQTDTQKLVKKILIK